MLEILWIFATLHLLRKSSEFFGSSSEIFVSLRLNIGIFVGCQIIFVNPRTEVIRSKCSNHFALYTINENETMTPNDSRVTGTKSWISFFQSPSAPSLNCPQNRAMKLRRVKEDKLSVEHTGFILLYPTRLRLHTVT